MKKFLLISAVGIYTTSINSSEISILKQQIKILSEKIDKLEKNNTKNHTIKKEKESIIKVNKNKNEVIIGKTKVSLNGKIQLDTIYDRDQFTGDSNNLPFLELKDSGNNIKKEHWKMNAKSSSITLNTNTELENHVIDTRISTDFKGSNNYNTGSINRGSSDSTTSYNLRFIEAYAEVDKKFLFGQTYTNFDDRHTYPEVLESNGMTGSGQIRNAQIRYKHDVMDSTTASFAIENPSTTYVDENGKLNGQGLKKSSSAGDGQSAVPDFTAKMVYEKEGNRFTLRGLLRQLRIKKSTAPAHNARSWGWGIAASGKMKVNNKMEISSNILFGKGMGRYSYDLVGLCAAFNAAKRRMESISSYSGNVGVQWKWTEKWRSNLSYGRNHVRIPSFMDSYKIPVTKRLEQYVINLIYNPIENLTTGVEYHRLKRLTTNRKKGVGNRVQIVFKYLF